MGPLEDYTYLKKTQLYCQLHPKPLHSCNTMLQSSAFLFPPRTANWSPVGCRRKQHRIPQYEQPTMSKDNIRYTQSQVMIKEVTLNAEEIYLNIHRLICMLSIKYEIGDEKLSDHKSEFCHREWRLYLSYRTEIWTLGKRWP